MKPAKYFKCKYCGKDVWIGYCEGVKVLRESHGYSSSLHWCEIDYRKENDN